MFSGGTGKINDPFLVSNQFDLYNVRSRVDACFLQTADIVITEATEGPLGWEPIGGNAVSAGSQEHTGGPFRGVYDGGGFSITGLRTSKDTGYIQGRPCGLFGGLFDAVIKNLTIVIAPEGINGHSNVGAVAGLANHRTLISDVTVTGGPVRALCIGTENDTSYVGGLVGSAQAYAGNSSGEAYFVNCVSEVDVECTGFAAGGIVGHLSGGAILRCRTSGQVKGGSGLGGLAGDMVSVTVSECVSESEIITIGEKGSFAGGLIGRIMGTGSTIMRSCAKGNVTGPGSALAGFAGLVRRVHIKDCYSTGDVTCTAETEQPERIASFIAYDAASGSSASSYVTVERCYSTGQVLIPNFPGYQYPTGFAGNIGRFRNTTTFRESVFSDNVYMETGHASGMGADPLSEAVMKTQAPYTDRGFNFSDYWHMDPSYNAGYPVLRCEVPGMTHLKTFSLVYKVNGGGTVNNYHNYTVQEGFNGSSISTSKESDFTDTSWSDGSTSFPRTDANVTGDILVYAELTNSLFSGGKGTRREPFILTTALQLAARLNFPSGRLRYVVQDGDIDLNTHPGGFWPETCYMQLVNYDGKGYSIKNLTLNNPGSSNALGLFRSIQASSIANSKLENVSVVGGLVAAGYAGEALSSKFYNCEVRSGTINTSTTAGTSYSGGFVAAVGSLGQLELVNCVSDATVGSNLSTFAGGIVGSSGSTSRVFLQNCVNEGDVTGWRRAGGLIGNLEGEGTILASSNKGPVTATEVISTSGAGGLVGCWTNRLGSNHMYSCYNEGVVVSNGVNTGGIVGYVRSVGDLRSPIRIEQTYNVADVVRLSGETGTDIAGFMGIADCRSRLEVVNCYNCGRVIYEDAVNPTNRGFSAIGHSMHRSSFENNFYNSDKGHTSGIGANPRTDDQMKSEATFTAAGFDMDYLWDIDPHINGGYPHLRNTFEYSGGTGDVSDPYQITDAVQLNWIRMCLLKNTHIVQKADLDLSGYSAARGWFPLRLTDAPFQAENSCGLVYDGEGRNISGLSISRWFVSSDRMIYYQGLFSYTTGLQALIGNFSISGSVNATVNASAIVGLASDRLTVYSVNSSCHIVAGDSGSSGILATGPGIYGPELVYDCHVTGAVSSSGSSYGGTSSAGGIAAVSGGPVVSCTVSGNVTAFSEYPDYKLGYTGGIVGDNFGTVINCKKLGAARIVGGSSLGVVGGIVGRGSATLCENESIVRGGYRVGGIAGIGTGIRRCVNKGSVQQRISSWVWWMSPHRTDDVGGLVGRFLGTTLQYDWLTSGDGVLTGEIDQVLTTIEDSINTGSVSYSTDIDPTPKIGGLAGGIHNGATVKKCYSTGSVSAGPGVSDKGGIGGTSGTGTVLFHSNYFDSETSGQASGLGASAKTTAEMHIESTFADWDFSGTWEIDAGYPQLRETNANVRGTLLPVRVDPVDPEGRMLHWSNVSNAFISVVKELSMPTSRVSSAGLQRIMTAYLLNQVNMTYLADTGGVIVGHPEGWEQKVPQYSDAEPVEVAADPGHYFSEWSDSSTENPRHDTCVFEDKTLTALIEEHTVTLTYSAGAGGTIDGTSPQVVPYGGSGDLVSAIPDPGYRFDQWSDGVSTPYRVDTEVVADLTVVALFVKTWEVAYSSGTGGAVSGPNPQVVDDGADSLQVTAIPSEGYRFDQWSDGNTDTSRKELNVTESLSFTALFVKTFNLKYLVSPSVGGYIEGTTSQIVDIGEDGSPVEAVAIPPYHFINWSDGLEDLVRQDLDIQENLTFTAIFGLSVLYVKQDARGNNNGTSWEDAFTDLQTALDYAEQFEVPVVRVAYGKYRPAKASDVSGGPRYRSFQLYNNTLIEGGYLGTGVERDVDKYPTILTGRYRNFNCYNVIRCPGYYALDNTCVLDGVTIEGGQAEGPSRHPLTLMGGGVCSELGNTFRLVNCTIRANKASIGGGICVTRMADLSVSKLMDHLGNTLKDHQEEALLNFSDPIPEEPAGTGSPIFEDCIIEDNDSVYGGGAALFQATLLVGIFRNSVIRDNRAVWGGGLAALMSTGIMTGHQGGASLFGNNPALTLKNNRASKSGGGFLGFRNNIPIAYILAEGNNALEKGGGMCLSGEHPVEMELCVLQKNSSPVGGGVALIAGTHLVRKTMFFGNMGGVAGGGIHTAAQTLTVDRVMFRNNRMVDSSRTDKRGAGISSSYCNTYVFNSYFVEGRADRGSAIHTVKGVTSLTGVTCMDNGDTDEKSTDIHSMQSVLHLRSSILRGSRMVEGRPFSGLPGVTTGLDLALLPDSLTSWVEGEAITANNIDLIEEVRLLPWGLGAIIISVPDTGSVLKNKTHRDNFGVYVSDFKNIPRNYPYTSIGAVE